MILQYIRGSSCKLSLEMIQLSQSLDMFIKMRQTNGHLENAENQFFVIVLSFFIICLIFSKQIKDQHLVHAPA